jgi:hypothetical protein
MQLSIDLVTLRCSQETEFGDTALQAGFAGIQTERESRDGKIIFILVSGR